MAQLTIRASDDLVDHIRRIAASEGRSMNDWVVFVLECATDPAFAADEGERIRERLRRAGLLAEPSPARVEAPAPSALEQARRRAGTGTPASDLVIEGRG